MGDCVVEQCCLVLAVVFVGVVAMAMTAVSARQWAACVCSGQKGWGGLCARVRVCGHVVDVPGQQGSLVCKAARVLLLNEHVGEEEVARCGVGHVGHDRSSRRVGVRSPQQHWRSRPVERDVVDVEVTCSTAVRSGRRMRSGCA